MAEEFENRVIFVIKSPEVLFLDPEVTSLSHNLGKMGQHSDLLNYIR